jgi:hypothetical protein
VNLIKIKPLSGLPEIIISDLIYHIGNSVELYNTLGAKARKTIKHINHANINKHILATALINRPIMIKRVDLGDKGHFPATSWASERFWRLNPLRLTAEFCSLS